MFKKELPFPDHFNMEKVSHVWRVPYQETARKAKKWRKQHNISASVDDTDRICLILVDVQNTFCIPDFELYVAGRSGTGAIDDNRRLCEFIYRNLHNITQIVPTMDTHQAMQVFHSIFFVNDKGEHPEPLTLITEEDIEKGVWMLNPDIGKSLQISPEYGEAYLKHYTRQLKESGKYDLTIWPYHAMIGGIGHALVSAVEEAVFFHTVARLSQADFHIKGENPLTEHYSVLGPEVRSDPEGEQIAQKSGKIIQKLENFDTVIIAGQAKSHCVAWTISDLLDEVMSRDRRLVEKVYLLEDCTSPVVIPGVVDYTEKADEAFQRFSDAGMHVVHSTELIEDWPGISDK